MEDMEELIQASIERVVDFFRELGITIDTLPTFKYIPETHPVSNLLIGQAPAELQVVRGLNESSIRDRLARTMPDWYKRRGVYDISAEAMGEYGTIAAERMNTFFGLTDESIAQLQSHDVDMLFFLSLEEIVNQNPMDKVEKILDFFNSHEIWHVVESRLGCLDSFIAEGTAEFAHVSYLAARGTTDFVVKIEENLFKTVALKLMGEALYKKGLEIVRSHVSTLPEVLNPEIREAMEGDLNRYFDDRVQSDVGTQVISYEDRALQTHAFWPELRGMIEGALPLSSTTRITKANYCDAIEASGAVILAGELRTQDCSGMLEEYERMRSAYKGLAGQA